MEVSFAYLYPIKRQHFTLIDQAENTYSIIVATYNRYAELLELFDTVDRLQFDVQRLEFVIVDDGSTDNTEELIKSLNSPFTIKYYKQQNQGPGAARNLGMRKAHGDYMIFIDSDVLLPHNYMIEIDRALKEQKYDAFGGPDDAHPSFSPLLKAINYSMTSFIGTGGTRGSKRSVGKFYPRSFNMGLHKRVYEKIGGMGGLRHGQDMDYSAKIYAAGFKVGLIPDAKVYHKRRTSFWRFFKQIFNWGVARVNLGKKHQGMLKLVHMLPALILGIGALIALASIFVAEVRPLLYLGLIGIMGIALLAFFQSSFKNRSIYVGLLSILTLFIQVGAYGMGMWSAWGQYARGAETAIGITKNYYK